MDGLNQGPQDVLRERVVEIIDDKKRDLILLKVEGQNYSVEVDATKGTIVLAGFECESKDEAVEKARQILIAFAKMLWLVRRVMAQDGP